MCNKVLYHGSTVLVDEPLVNVGRKELDFGPGFYVTNDIEQAKSWARTLAGRKKNARPMVNIYDFDIDGFERGGYAKHIFKEYNVEWLDFVSESRKGREPWKDFDWIEGGIANDSVISTVDAYVDGFITAEQALDKLVKEELRHQVCISKQSIINKYLKFVSCEEVL